MEWPAPATGKDLLTVSSSFLFQARSDPLRQRICCSRSCLVTRAVVLITWAVSFSMPAYRSVIPRVIVPSVITLMNSFLRCSSLRLCIASVDPRFIISGVITLHNSYLSWDWPINTGPSSPSQFAFFSHYEFSFLAWCESV